MTEQTVDIDYIRDVGNHVREALFPRERWDGRVPYPLPVLLRYRLPDGYEVDVKFVLIRTYQHIESNERVVSEALVDVTFEGYYIGEVDVAFGNEFDVNSLDYWVGDSTDGPGTWPDRDLALNNLLSAIAGTL